MEFIMQVTLRIKRFNPEKDKESWWGEYKFEEEPTDRLLDALNHVKWRLDGTLTYRRLCHRGAAGGHGHVPREVPQREALPDHPRPRSGKGTLAVAGRSREVRRHDQVHPMRSVHVQLPVLLGKQRLRGTGGDCQCPPPAAR